jgi:hypothetical protein
VKLLNDLFDKVKAAGDYHRRRTELRHLMFQSVSDGVLSDTEIQTIEARCRALELPPEEITNLKTDLYLACLKNATADRRLNPDEAASLERIANHFEVPPEVTQKSQAELARYRLLFEIEQGRLPAAEAPGVELKPGEVVHWAEQGSLLEEKVVSREYVPGGGISIGRGTTFKIGSQRGEFKTKTEMVTVATGVTYITNQRLILVSERNTLPIELTTVQDIQLHHDTVVVMVQGRTDPYILQTTDPSNIEVIGAIIGYVMNHLREPALQ